MIKMSVPMMHDVAETIRKDLRGLGYNNRAVTVQCDPGYKIIIKTGESPVDSKEVRESVMKIYHSHDHAWLMIEVDGDWLPMPRTGRKTSV